jgi:L-alanine-DL-glutamate epimerase-like enolase superfamily enzyme
MGPIDHRPTDPRSRCVGLAVHHLVLPLTRPYVLPFGPLARYDCFVAVARFADGRVGLGESMPLPGYSHETAEQITADLAKLEATGDLAAFRADNRANPFVVTAIETALEPGPIEGVAADVALCPIVQEADPERLGAEVERLALLGATVAKVKIGPPVAARADFLKALAAAGKKSRMKFRFDANQTLDVDGTRRVLAMLDPETTELLEQPLPIDRWDEMRRLRRESPVPLMLDEAIAGEEDVERAVGAADLVKLKLMKNVTPARVLRLIERARSLGLGVVLGNGAQGTIGCLLEARIQAVAALERPGEMNGHAKIADDPFADLIEASAVRLRVRADASFERAASIAERAAKRTFHLDAAVP